MRAFLAIRLLSVVAILAVSLPAVRAHKVSAVSVVTEIDTVKRTCKVELAMEVEPTGDPAIDDQISPEQAATTFATEALIVYFDDEPVDAGEPEIRVIDESDEATPEDLKRKKVVATVTRDIAEEAENFLMYVDENTEAAVVMVVIKDGQPARRLQVLYPGEFSNPVNVERVVEGDPFPAAEQGGESRTSVPMPGAGEEQTDPERSGAEPPPVTAAADSPAARVAIFGLVALFVIAAVFVVVFLVGRAGDSKRGDDL